MTNLGQTFLLVSLVIVLNTLGNTFLSIGMKTASGSFVGALLRPAVVTGIIFLIGWTLARMHLLGRADLSFVLPVTSSGYVLNALIGHFVLGEQITGGRWFGTLLIVSGTVLVVLTLPGARIS